jgi:hypothetical protein
LRKDGANIVIEVDGAERGRAPLHMIGGVVCFGHSGASPALMAACADAGIALSSLPPQREIPCSGGRGCGRETSCCVGLNTRWLMTRFGQCRSCVASLPPRRPLAMFKALLLSIWYDQSDVKLTEALYGRASFRRFCGFSASEAAPERTSFFRIRKLLAAQKPDRSWEKPPATHY